MDMLEQIIETFKEKGYTVHVHEQTFEVEIGGKTPEHGLPEIVRFAFQESAQLQDKCEWARAIEEIISNPFRKIDAMQRPAQNISHYEIFKDLVAFDESFIEMWFAIMDLPGQWRADGYEYWSVSDR